jgi:hypothetical protein
MPIPNLRERKKLVWDNFDFVYLQIPGQLNILEHLLRQWARKDLTYIGLFVFGLSHLHIFATM